MTQGTARLETFFQTVVMTSTSVLFILKLPMARLETRQHSRFWLARSLSRSLSVVGTAPPPSLSLHHRFHLQTVPGAAPHHPRSYRSRGKAGEDGCHPANQSNNLCCFYY